MASDLLALLRAARYRALLNRTEGRQPPAAMALRARALQRLGRSEEALALARRAFAQRPGDDQRLALGEALLGAAQLHEARALLHEVEAPRLRRLLAEVEAAAGRPEQGLGVALSAIAAAEDPVDAAEAHATVAACLHRSGRYPAAEPQWEEALRRTMDALGQGHPDVAALLDGLAATLRRLGRPEEALDRHRAALPLHVQAFGAVHPGVAGCLHGQAQCLRRLGDFTGAREALAEALEISRRAQGQDHPDAWITAFELGRMEVDCGQVEEGFGRMVEARDAAVRLLGEEHPTVRAMEGWL